MWCWRRMEKISWTDCVRNEEVLHTVKEERNIPHTINRRKSNWIGHILRRNCILKHFIEGSMEEGTEAAGRQETGCKQSLDDLKKTRGYSKLKQEALDHNVWRTRFGRGCGFVVRHTAECWWSSWHFLLKNSPKCHAVLLRINSTWELGGGSEMRSKTIVHSIGSSTVWKHCLLTSDTSACSTRSVAKLPCPYLRVMPEDTMKWRHSSLHSFIIQALDGSTRSVSRTGRFIPVKGDSFTYCQEYGWKCLDVKWTGIPLSSKN